MEADFQNIFHYTLSQVPPKSLLFLCIFQAEQFHCSESSTSFLKRNELRERQVIISSCSYFWPTSDLFVHSCLSAPPHIEHETHSWSG